MANHDEATTTQAPQVAPVPPAQASGPVFIAPEADAQAPARNNQYVLKSGDAFVVSDALGDIGGHDDGLFVDDMRVLSTWRLTFGGRAPSLLSGAIDPAALSRLSEYFSGCFSPAPGPISLDVAIRDAATLLANEAEQLTRLKYGAH